MDDLFALSAPWWHFVLRALAIYVLVMVLMRISGKRAVGQLTPFDLVLLILIGNAVQNGINGGDNSLTGAALMATTLIALNYGVAWVTSRNAHAERLIDGVPVLLARDGVRFDAVLRREMVSDADFETSLRAVGISDIAEVALAVLEVDGKISVIRANADSQASPSSDCQSRGRR